MKPPLLSRISLRQLSKACTPKLKLFNTLFNTAGRMKSGVWLGIQGFRRDGMRRPLHPDPPVQQNQLAVNWTAAAVALNPDYIGVGPVFPTPTKAIADPALGIERAGKIIQSSPLTCVALGGLDETNLPAVLNAGAVNFCAIRAIMQSPDPEKVIRALQQINGTATRDFV